MSNDFWTHLSRATAHALRHEPWLYELELDDEGWTDVESILKALREERAAWRQLAAADLAEMIERSEKKRYEIREGRIRALYGHSTPARLTKVAAPPPAELFHGTSAEAAVAIRAQGLRPMSRQYVHLSIDRATAIQVGKRKTSQPLVLRVSATTAHAAGVPFYVGNDKVWLADMVPAEFIDFGEG